MNKEGFALAPWLWLKDNAPEWVIAELEQEKEQLKAYLGTLKGENEKLREINALLRIRFQYYGRVLTKEANREDVLLTAQEPEK